MVEIIGYVIMLLLLECLVEIILLRKRLNNYFFIVNKGLFFKHTVFMSVNRRGKEDIKGLSGIKRGRFFDYHIRSMINLLPKKVKIRTKTHNSIVKIIEDAQSKNIITDLKIKECRSKTVIMEKLSINNHNKLFKKKRFFKVSFIVQ